jgi:hypothetical protein
MRFLITKRKDFPKCLRLFKELKGICIGECVNREKLDYNEEVAHTHYYGNPYGFDGWMCLNYKYQLKQKLLLLHEVAHLLVEYDFPLTLAHGKEWKAAVKSIGGTYKSFPLRFRGIIENNDYTYRHT